jgi:hypothetical protein
MNYRKRFIVLLFACGIVNLTTAALASGSGSSGGGVISAGGHAKIPVPPLPFCPRLQASQTTWPSQIAKEYERIGGPASPIGCPLTGFIADASSTCPVVLPNCGSGSGIVQFAHGQIAISTSVWGDGVVAAYQDAWCAGDGSCANGNGRIVVDWNTSWTEPSPFSFNKFLVRWDYEGQHYDDGNACDQMGGWRGSGDQCDVLADMTAVQFPFLKYYTDTHLYTKGNFVVWSYHGNGTYRISVKGCNEGITALGGDSCQPAWMHPVEVHFDGGQYGFPVDLSSVPNVEPNSNWLQKQDAFFRRAAAITRYHACEILPWKAYRNEPTYGDIILAKLAYAEFYNDDHCPGRVTANRDEAFSSLLQQTIESKTGTSTTSCPGCRTGEYDVALSGYVAVLHQFGSILPGNVSDHILNDLLNKRGAVDEGDFTVDGVRIPGVGSVGGVPETENHVNLIESAQFLTNDLLFDKTGDPDFNNDANGMTAWWLKRLQAFMTQDFIEYNARPYQSYTDIALQNLYSFARNQDVKTAAGMVLDYISAKIAMSSNQARRAVPYRRRKDFNQSFLLTWAADTQAPRNLALVGNLDILTEICPPVYNGTNQPGCPYRAPAYGSGDMLRAVLSDYRIPDLLVDLIINPAHRLFYQGLHYVGDELYASSPSFLISAGGHYADPPYLVLGIGSSDDIGMALPTTIMPTGHFISRDDLVQFQGVDTDQRRSNMCVAPNFACGINPVVPDRMKACNVPPTSRLGADWTFINFSGPCTGHSGPYGFYMAVFRSSDTATQWGLAEVFDTMVNPNLTMQKFMDGVLQRNPRFNPNDGTYVTTTGEIIEFTIRDLGNPNMDESRILSITNGPQAPIVGFLNGIQEPLAYGEFLSTRSPGVLVITNGYLGTSRILDFHDVAHPLVIDPVSIPAFTYSTCLPGFVWRQAVPGDAVCVTAATELNIQQQNLLGPSRTDPNYLVHVCLPGFVPRQADSHDNVCVTQADHDEVSFDNLLAPSRRAIP